MPVRYLITVGTSLIENFERSGDYEQQGRPVIRDCLPGDVDGLLCPVGDWPSNPALPFQPNVLEWALAKWGSQPLQTTASGPRVRPLQQTAEITTLAKLQPQRDDQAVLISSNTVKGFFCALVQAYMISATGRVEYAFWENADQIPTTSSLHILGDDPPSSPGGRVPKNFPKVGKATLIRVNKLDPTRKQDFEEEGAANLVSLLTRQIRQAQMDGYDPKVIFTGGFKAALPLLTQAVAWMGSVPLIGLYEGARDIIQVPTLKALPEKNLCRASLGFGRTNISVYDRGVIGIPGEWNYDHKYRHVEDIPDFDEKALFKDTPNGLALSLIGRTLANLLVSMLAEPTGEAIWKIVKE